MSTEPTEPSQDRNLNPDDIVPIQVSTPFFTYLMVGCLIAVYLVQLNVGIERSEVMAAFDKRLFAAGADRWRILTSIVTHGPIPHIVLNAFALFSFGRLIEVLSNRAHLGPIFLFSAISGNILSLTFAPNGKSIGASGGIIGFLGFIAVYAIKRRQFLAAGFVKNIFINIGLVVLVGAVLYRVIDNYGHIGGILTGTIYGLIQIPRDPYTDPREVNNIIDVLGFICLGIFVAISFFTAIYLLNII